MRMAGWFVVALILSAGCFFIAPAQLEVLVWKGALLTSLFWLGYWLDRTAFPYARPHAATSYELGAWYQIRRALIMLAVVIGGCIAI